MKGLKQRWGLTSNWQLAVIFVVFAITGSASAYLSKPFCTWLGIGKEELGLLVHPNSFTIDFSYLSSFIGSNRFSFWSI